MKLYLTPGACSLADHIALHEGGFDFAREKVDLKTKKTESGEDYTAVNPKGYVPALELDGGEVLTENIAILDWIVQQRPDLAPQGPLGRSRLLEALAFISTELHKNFKPFFAGAGEEDKAKARDMLARRFDQLAATAKGPFLFGEAVSAADAYLFVMLFWAGKNDVPVPDRLAELHHAMLARPAVKLAMDHEGLSSPS